MHYRKQLFDFLKKSTGFNITVVDTNTTANKFLEGHISLKSKIRKIPMFGKKYEINYSGVLFKFIDKNCMNYDIIILEGASNVLNNIFICRKLKKHKIPYICWDAGRRVGSKMTPIRVLAQPFIKSTLKNAVACIAYSSVAKSYITSLGIPREKIFICQNTLNVSYFDEQLKSISPEKVTALKQSLGFEDKKIILYVGALEKRKRVDDLIYAFKQVNNDTYALLIVGSGDDRQRLELLCKTLAVHNAHFAGEVIEGVIEYFLICDVFVLPSEGGLAINQAMICSKPIIASSADGTERDLIIPGKNGFLFHEGNVDELRKSLITVLESDSSSLGRYSRHIINQFFNENNFTKVFLEVIKYIQKM